MHVEIEAILQQDDHIADNINLPVVNQVSED